MAVTPHYGDDLPSVLYRVFDEEEYAIQFLNGRIRLTFIECMRKHEDPNRRDPTEGTGHIKTKDHKTGLFKDSYVELGSERHKRYILCFFSESNLDNFLKIGKHITIIHNPIKLAEDITSYMSLQSDEYIGGVEYRWVKYDKGDLYSETPEGMEWDYLSAFQKPSSFKNEKEVRFAVIAKTNLNKPNMDHLFINLNKKLGYIKYFRG